MKNGCQDIRSELSAYVDNELSPAERAVVEGHLSGCPGCQRELEQLKSLAAGVAALPKLQPAPEFLAEVRRRIAQANRPAEPCWREYLFRPIWLKVPLETVAVLVAAALVMRFGGERLLRHEAKMVAEPERRQNLTVERSEPMNQPLPTRPVGGAVVEAPGAKVAARAAAEATGTPADELQQQAPAAVVVVHATDFDQVKDRAQQLAEAMDGRVIPSANRGAVTLSFLVELPEEYVAAFESDLLRVAGQARPAEAQPFAGRSAALSSGATPAERKSAAVILEIQVVPPKG